MLVLEPSHDRNAPLRFSFHAVPLEKLAGRYEALSYVWGKPKLDFPLYHKDGTRVWVTKNLDSALRRLRERHDARWLWADAVCINQENNDEKGVQVQLMGQIYREAKRVVAWLGSGGGEEEEGLRVLAASSRAPRYSDPATSTEFSASFTYLCAFFSLQWFKRLWIVQECVLNADLNLIYGVSEISMVRLIAGLRLFSQGSTWSNQPENPAIRSIATKVDLWRTQSMIDSINAQVSTIRPSCDILDLVAQFVDHECSNDHDRIFALYGLASKISPTDKKEHGATLLGQVYMDVDYSSSILQSYTNFAFACMESGAVAQVLNAALTRQTDQDSSDWPSWVPDWRRSSVRRPILALLEPTDTVIGKKDARRGFFTPVRTSSSSVIEMQIRRSLPVYDQSDPEDHLCIDRTFTADSMDSLIAAFFNMLEGIGNDSSELLEVLRRILDLSASGPLASRELSQKYMQDDPARPKFPNPIFDVRIDTRTELKQDVFCSEVLAAMQEKTFFTAKIKESPRPSEGLHRHRDWFFGAGSPGLRSGDRLFYFNSDRTVHVQDSKFLMHKRPAGGVHESIALALRPSTQETVTISGDQACGRYRLCGGAFIYRYQDPTTPQLREKEYVTTIELE